MDVALALDYIIPGAQYRGSLTANTEEAYNAIEWLETDPGKPKPSWASIQAAWDIIDLQNTKAEKKAAVRALADSLFEAGFEHNGFRFRIERDNLTEILGIRAFAESSLSWEAPKWPKVGGGFYEISTKEDALSFSEKALYRLRVHNASVVHQQAIEALQTKTAVDLYDITTGWPG